jgi:hypothetical protein
MKFTILSLVAITLICSCKSKLDDMTVYDFQNPAPYGDFTPYHENWPVVFKNPDLILTFEGKGKVPGFVKNGNLTCHKFIARGNSTHIHITECHSGLVSPMEFELEGQKYFLLSDPSFAPEHHLIVFTNQVDAIRLFDPDFDPVENQKAHDQLMKKMQNQQVEPIVTTPVDKVEAQSTQAHP